MKTIKLFLTMLTYVLSCVLVNKYFNIHGINAALIGCACAFVVLGIITLCKWFYDFYEQFIELREQVKRMPCFMKYDDEGEDLESAIKKMFPDAEVKEIKRTSVPSVDEYLNHPQIKGMFDMAKKMMQGEDPGDTMTEKVQGTYLQKIQEQETQIEDLKKSYDGLLDLYNEKSKYVQDIVKVCKKDGSYFTFAEDVKKILSPLL